jgi:hypothetical protein
MGLLDDPSVSEAWTKIHAGDQVSPPSLPCGASLLLWCA